MADFSHEIYKESVTSLTLQEICLFLLFLLFLSFFPLLESFLPFLALRLVKFNGNSSEGLSANLTVSAAHGGLGVAVHGAAGAAVRSVAACTVQVVGVIGRRL